MNLRQRWQAYWFRPVAPVDLTLVRVILVGYQLLHLVGHGTRAALRATELAPAGDYDPLPIVRLLAWPFAAGERIDTAALLAIHDGTLVCGAAALIGLAPRLSLTVFAAGNLLLQGYLYSFGAFHHPEALMLIALALLAAGPRASWPHRVVQWMFVLVYLSAAASKLGRSGLEWANGETLQYWAFHKGFQTGAPLGVWLSAHHVIAAALSAGVLLFEGTFVLALLRPRWQRVYLPLGVLIHVSIFLTLGAPFFQFIALYAVFLPWRWRRSRAVPAPPIDDVSALAMRRDPDRGRA